MIENVYKSVWEVTRTVPARCDVLRGGDFPGAFGLGQRTPSSAATMFQVMSTWTAVGIRALSLSLIYAAAVVAGFW